MTEFTVALAGNPNCGKSTVFNALTGARQRVGNWPGVTVEKKTGTLKYDDATLRIVDLPGIYSLSASSEDERIARDYLMGQQADLIVNIVDAVNLERGLYLTLQLLESGARVLLVLNMMDVAGNLGIQIFPKALADYLGCPVVPVTATREEGIRDLSSALYTALTTTWPMPQFDSPYPEEVKNALATLAEYIERTGMARDMDPSWLALKLLEGDSRAAAWADARIVHMADDMRRDIEEVMDEDMDILIADSRYKMITLITSQVIRRREKTKRSFTDKVDAVLLHRLWSFPIFLGVMYLVFFFSINIGGAFIDFFDILAGAVFVDGAGVLLNYVHTPDWLVVILADGVGGALQTIATFIPPIAFMFIALSFLEDSGYMARAAFVVDRLMQFIGLPGKSFIPMLIGFGCNVPAIMATRTLDNQRDRLMTIMMNPFMSCGARLPVYALFAAAFFPKNGQNIVFALYLIGIGFAVATGLALKNTLLQGPITPFVMELPMYHFPTFRGVVLTAWDRLKTFILKAGKIVIPVILLLNSLNTMGIDGSIGNENSEKSLLAMIGKRITPVFAPMGVSHENWPAAVGLFTGIFAKEAVVGTLDTLYDSMGTYGMTAGDEDRADTGMTAYMVEALLTIPVNLSDALSGAADPLGLSVGDTADTAVASEAQGVNLATFMTLTDLFKTKAAAFSYMLFVLLYFPCVAAIAAVYRETDLKWTVFAGAWTTFIAYAVAVVFYQMATYTAHPKASMNWLIILSALVAVILLLMKYFHAVSQSHNVPASASKARGVSSAIG